MRDGRRSDRFSLFTLAASRAALRPMEPLWPRRLFAFGVTTTASSLIVDTDAQTVFTVARVKGELTSAKLSGTELLAPYSKTARYSHCESGLSSDTTVTATTEAGLGTATIACVDPTLGVAQYYIAKKGSTPSSWRPTRPRYRRRARCGSSIT